MDKLFSKIIITHFGIRKEVNRWRVMINIRSFNLIRGYYTLLNSYRKKASPVRTSAKIKHRYTPVSIPQGGLRETYSLHDLPSRCII